MPPLFFGGLMDNLNALYDELVSARSTLQMQIQGYMLMSKAKLAERVWRKVRENLTFCEQQLKHVEYTIAALEGLKQSTFGQPYPALPAAETNDLESAANKLKKVLTEVMGLIDVDVIDRLHSMADVVLVALQTLGYRKDAGEARKLIVQQSDENEWNSAG